MVNVVCDLHMVKGDGETSYAKNSRLQEKAMFKIKPILAKATREAYTALLPENMVIADLGCSSGPNTLLFVYEVISAITDHCNKLGRRDHVQLQFFLNDLPGNDFNQLFRSLEQFKKSIATNRMGETLPPYYISGLPNSYYSRLFPRQSVHLFHSTYCLQWSSKVPEGLEVGREAYLNEDNIYITKTTPPSVVKLFQEQFQKDFSLFLKLRHEELVFGGRMVLTFPGRKSRDVFSGEFNHLFELLTVSLQSLVAEGLVEKEKLKSFHLPLYGPSITEVKAIVKQTGLFCIDHIQRFYSNWDPSDDSEGDVVHDSVAGGANVAGCIRAVTESLIASHFGETILDALFAEYARNVAKHLEKEKTKYAVVVLSLKKTG